MMRQPRIEEDRTLRDRTGVFADRAAGGHALVGLLRQCRLQNPLLLAVPAGGVPVAAAMAAGLNAELAVAVVSKITLPWNSEAGYGAVAFDGSYLLNHQLIPHLGLGADEIAAGIAATRRKVERRLTLFQRWLPPQELAGRTLMLVDDGLASGFTLQTALAALRRTAAAELLLAVPTAHLDAATRLAAEVDGFFCANLRGGRHFAVAAAYRHWRDIPEAEALQLLEAFPATTAPRSSRQDRDNNATN